MTVAENRQRIEELEERVEKLEAMLDELTDDVLADLDDLESSTRTLTKLQEMLHPEEMAEAREIIEDA